MSDELSEEGAEGKAKGIRSGVAKEWVGIKEGIVAAFDCLASKKKKKNFTFSRLEFTTIRQFYTKNKKTHLKLNTTILLR